MLYIQFVLKSEISGGAQNKLKIMVNGEWWSVVVIGSD
jgi:hypothetical protein